MARVGDQKGLSHLYRKTKPAQQGAKLERLR